MCFKQHSAAIIGLAYQNLGANLRHFFISYPPKKKLN